MNRFRLKGKQKEKRDEAVKRFEFEYPQASQKRIADAFGLTQGTVSKILKGG